MTPKEERIYYGTAVAAAVVIALSIAIGGALGAAGGCLVAFIGHVAGYVKCESDHRRAGR